MAAEGGGGKCRRPFERVLPMRAINPAVRTCAAVLLFIVAIAAMHVGFADAVQTGAAKPVMLIYVGAKNCGPCEAWQRTEAARFRASPEFGRVVYREVESPSLRSVLDDANWPPDLLAYRQEIDRNGGVPLWMVVVDGQIVHQDFGLSQWRRTVFPTLAALVRAAR